MKTDIHPEYKTAVVTCACGNTFETRSTLDSIHVEICSRCHPFFTGRQKLVDTAGRVERFRRKYGEGPAKRRKGRKAKAAAGQAAETAAPQEEEDVPAQGDEERTAAAAEETEE